MKILITGSSGMLGQALCKNLAAKHEIIGFDIRKSQSCYDVDLTNADVTVKKITEIKPDIIIHCAAYTDVDGAEKYKDRAHKLNVQATENATAAAKKVKAFLIYISTDFVFDGKKNSPYNEQDEPNPINFYGETKLKGELAIKDILDKHLIIRTSWLFGIGGNNFVDTIIEKAKKENQIKVVNDQVGSPTYTIDLAEAIAGIVDRGQRTEDRGQVLNITNSGSCSWYEFAKEIIKLAGIRGVGIIPIVSEELDRPAKRPRMSILDNSKFYKIYGSALPPWRDALKRYLNERKANR